MKLLQQLAISAEALAQRFAVAKVLVVGDVMLDRYWFGDTHRISPEAPVPIAKIEKIDQRAGGAANVARNIACLGGQASLLSVTGDDEAADALYQLMTDCGVSAHLMRQFAFELEFGLVAIQAWCGGEQGAGVRMARLFKDGFFGAVFHRFAQIHHHQIIGHMAHYRQIVRNKHIGRVVSILQIHEQIQDLRLYRHVQS